MHQNGKCNGSINQTTLHHFPHIPTCNNSQSSMAKSSSGRFVSIVAGDATWRPGSSRWSHPGQVAVEHASSICCTRTRLLPFICCADACLDPLLISATSGRLSTQTDDDPSINHSLTHLVVSSTRRKLLLVESTHVMMDPKMGTPVMARSFPSEP